MSQWAVCSPAWWFLYHMIVNCKGLILFPRATLSHATTAASKTKLTIRLHPREYFPAFYPSRCTCVIGSWGKNIFSPVDLVYNMKKFLRHPLVSLFKWKPFPGPSEMALLKVSDIVRKLARKQTPLELNCLIYTLLLTLQQKSYSRRSSASSEDNEEPEKAVVDSQVG